MSTPILELRNVSKRYGNARTPIWALAGVSLFVLPGETLGIVGESGSGKSTVARIAVGLDDPTSGDVLIQGAPIGAARNPLQMVFQDPASSLDPLFRVARSIDEPLRAQAQPAGARGARVASALREVGLGAEGGARYPNELSGGQKQRASIARALATLPPAIVCDEAVTALDVSIRAQVLNLLRAVQKEHGTAYVFISHDLCTVAYMSDRIMVMYLGKVVEVGTTGQLFAAPGHPYTFALISAVPSLQQGSRKRARLRLAGEPPSVMRLPTGCRFHTRCPIVQERCRLEEPPLREIAPSQFAACHYAPVDEAAVAAIGALANARSEP